MPLPTASTKEREKAMYCVEIDGRRRGDLGISVVVLAEGPVEATAEVRRIHPEYVGGAKKNGRVYEVAHLEIDWDTGRTFIMRKSFAFVFAESAACKESLNRSWFERWPTWLESRGYPAMMALSRGSKE